MLFLNIILVMILSVLFLVGAFGILLLGWLVDVILSIWENFKLWRYARNANIGKIKNS